MHATSSVLCDITITAESVVYSVVFHYTVIYNNSVANEYMYAYTYYSYVRLRVCMR